MSKTENNAGPKPKSSAAGTGRGPARRSGTNGTAGSPRARDGAPLHGQVRNAIEASIEKGDYPPGSVLPGELDLAEKFDVSRITVKRALNDLALAGYVRRYRGRGTIVNPRPGLAVVRGSFSTFIDNLRTMGLETEVTLLEVGDVAPAADVAAALQLAPGAVAQRAVRIRYLDGAPFSHLVTHVPVDIAAGYSSEALATTPLLKLLEQAGVTVTGAEQSMAAVAASPDVAARLHVAAGSPLLRIFRIMKDADGRPVQAIEAHYPGDRFHYQMKLTRRRSDGADRWSDS